MISASFTTERWNKKFEYNKALVILDLVIPKNQGVPQNILLVNLIYVLSCKRVEY